MRTRFFRGFRVPLGISLILLGVFLFLPYAAVSETRDARTLLDEVQRLDDGERHWRDRTRRMRITIHDRRGGERLRDLSMRTLRDEDPGGRDEKILAVFASPPEIRGTSFLQFQHRDRDADQWLYLPELRRVRKITSSVKHESFMGTDFSYRDMELLTDVLEWSSSEAKARLVGSSTIEGRPAHRIELTPVIRDVGYERIVVVLTSDDLVLRAMEFYREGDEPVKKLELGRVSDVGRIPTAHEMVMRQPAEGTHTVVAISDVRYDQGLPEELFTKRSLERGVDVD